MSLLLSTWPDVLLFVWVNNFDWTTSFYCSYMHFYSSCPFSWALGSWLGSMYMHIDIVHTWCKVTQLSGNASPQNSHGIMASSVGVYQICLHIYWWINTNAFSHVPLYMHAAMYPFWLQRLCTFSASITAWSEHACFQLMFHLIKLFTVWNLMQTVRLHCV